MKKWMMLSAFLLTAPACFAAEADVMRDGLFIGLGPNYNSIMITQNSWGRGVSNIQTSTGSNSNGVAQGTGAPFYNTTNTFSPEIHFGYFKHFAGTQNLYGLKFTYQYVGSTATNSNLYIPQIGVMASSTGATSSLFGYVNADSVQVTNNHELTLMAFLGRSFGKTYVYLGAGPSVFSLQSKNYYSIGYAIADGATVNVTGLVSYASPTIWAWGGAAQLGATYFLSPTWFIDLSYAYAITGDNSTYHQQRFANSSSLGSVNYATSGTLYTKDTLSIRNQSLALTINKVL